MKRVIFIFVVLAVAASRAFAHEVRPAYLEMHQSDTDTYDVLWKVPGRGEDLRLGLYVDLPAGCTNVTEPRASMANNAFSERWAVKCAGGLIGGRITNIAGSSDYFERAAVVYSNTAKTEMLDVPQNLVEHRGAVSSEVAAAMAQGIRQAAHTDLGLSVTGIAGPGGGTEKKPVGLVYTALASPQGVKTAEHRFLGNREQIRNRAVQMALDMVRRHLIT